MALGEDKNVHAEEMQNAAPVNLFQAATGPALHAFIPDCITLLDPARYSLEKGRGEI